MFPNIINNLKCSFSILMILILLSLNDIVNYNFRNYESYSIVIF